MMLAFLFSLAMNGVAYWLSDKIVLRMYGAREIGAGEAPKLYRTIQELALRAQMPMPKRFLIPQEGPNAFTTGRDERHAAIAVTKVSSRSWMRQNLGKFWHMNSLTSRTATSSLGPSQPPRAHMFIVNPLTGGGLMTLFSTHPPIE